MSQETQTFTTFNLQKLADGVFAVLAGSNGGIIDLGDQTIIFDTFSNLATANELRAVAEQLTGRSAAFVINSHPHADHFNGNKVFADHAVLVSSVVTHAKLTAEGSFRMERMKTSMLRELDTLTEQLSQTTDQEKRAKLHMTISEYQEFFESYPTAEELALPILTFERALTFHGSKRSAQLLTFGGAHSPCDAILWLPDDKILFVGDLIIPNGDLILHDGQPENWLPILDQMAELGSEVIVPGHRKVTSAPEAFAWARQYLTNIFQLAESLTLESVEQLETPAGLRTHIFRNNLRFLIERR